MAKPESENEVTVRRLSDVIVGVWDKVKANTVSDVAWDSTNSKLTKTKNGTTSDVVTKSTLLSALGGSIEDGNTGFVTGDAAYDALALKANLASPTFTGTPKAPTAATGTNTTQIATTAFVKTAVDTAIAGVADALIYKGTVAGGSTGSYGALTPAANKGDTYKVSTAGKIDGKVVEVGDMLICNTDNTAQATDSNYATIAANWDVIQANIDGAVTGPASSTDAHIATFNGATGKVIKDSGYTIATSVPSGAVFTDTKVTAVGNHYTPATDSGAEKDASGGTATELPTTNGSSNVQVVTGITMDAKGHVTGVVSKGLYSHDTTYESKSAVSGGSTVSLCTTGEKYTWDNKQDALQTQTAYTSKGTATKVPQITTNTLGQVTGITEVTISGVTPASHAHGSITNDGKIGSTSGYAVYTTSGGALTAGSLAVSSPSASGNTLAFIDTISQDAKGQITATKKSVTVDSSYSSTGTNPVNGKAIKAAIDGLDATVTSTNGTNVQISVVETDGKLTSASVTTDNTENKNNKVTSWSATTTDTHYPSEKLVKDTIDEQGQVVAAALNDLDDRITECEAITTSGAVLYNTAQSLTTDEKSQARSNIGAGTSNLTIGTTSSTAAAGNHAHTTTLASDEGSSAITLSAGGKYKLTAGGNSVIFTMPADIKVKATAKTNNADYKILAAASTNPDSSIATEAVYSSTGISLNPSTNTITANLSGNATTATTATNYATSGGIATALANKAASSHSHGYISNTGTLTDTAAAAAGSDYVVIRDADTSKIQTSTIKGTDVADAVSNKHSHSTLTLSTTAQAYDGSHTLALPSTDPYTSARTPASHTHGNITNGGALQTDDVAIASGDKLVITDSSDSNKVARASISFDGSTATKALTQKGTWEIFNNYTHPTSSGNKHVPSGGSSGQFLGWDSDGTAKWVANPNTDTKVKATASTSNSEFKILATSSASPTSGNATEAVYGAGVTLNPSTNTITANISGTASAASSAASGSALETAINGKAASDHTHTTSLATDTGTSSITLASAGTYKLTAGGTNVIFKMPTIPSGANNGALKIGLNGGTATSKFTANQSTDSTLTFATGSANGTISVDGTDVAVKGLGSAAYTASTAYATSGHTHTTSIASSSATSSLTLEVGKKYSISAGGTSYVFTNGTEMTTTEVDDLLAVLT